MKISCIPKLETPIEGWKDIPIRECGEKLVSLNEALQGYPVVLKPQYYLQGVRGALPGCYAREAVAEKLIKAASYLPSKLRLVIWDAWRPFEIQSALFDEYRTRLKLQYPELSEDEITKETSTFVSIPSTNPLCPSPHNTGGAIDLSIVDCDERYLEMGTGFDDFSPKARTRYFEDRFEIGNISASEMGSLWNRRLLFSVMTRAGFTNYPEEWWHFDYGNQFWARLSGSTVALYGSCLLEP